MSPEENAAVEWLVTKGVNRDAIVKNIGSPDFTTPIGMFEVKRPDTKNGVHFTFSQLRVLDKLDYTVLVFQGSTFIEEIQSNLIKHRRAAIVGMKVRIYYEDYSPILSIRITPAMNRQLERISEESGRDISDIVRGAVLAFIGMYNDATRRATTKQ